jgi:endonuclease/exonuclease/phosphatase family metal-dependent hydrolase
MKDFSVLSWNIQGETNITGHTRLSKVKPCLEAATADVLVLQEVCNARALLERCKLTDRYPHVYVPVSNTKPYGNRSIVVSKFPIVQSVDIVFPNFGQERSLENAARVDINLGEQVLRIYSCHFPIFRAGPALRLKQLEFVFADAAQHTGPVIVCGDLNTTIPAPGINRVIINTWHMEPQRDFIIDGKKLAVDEREVVNQFANQHGCTEALPLWTSTWSPFKTKLWELFSLKLDWFMVKGLHVTNYSLDDYISDHRAITVHVSI